MKEKKKLNPLNNGDMLQETLNQGRCQQPQAALVTSGTQNAASAALASHEVSNIPNETEERSLIDEMMQRNIDCLNPSNAAVREERSNKIDEDLSVLALPELPFKEQQVVGEKENMSGDSSVHAEKLETAQEDFYSKPKQRGDEVSREELYKEPKLKNDDPVTATVYLAAPKTTFKVALMGDDQNLGCWREPRGKFEIFKSLGDQCIYKGTIPVPFHQKSPFKFIQIRVDHSGAHILFEGIDEKDNRYDELLPNSVNFFFFKAPPEGLAKSFYTTLKNLVIRQPRNDRRVVSEFLKIVYDRALQDLNECWDASFDTVIDGLKKISDLSSREELIHSFDQFLAQQLNQEQQMHDNHRILLLFAVAALIGFKTKTLGKLLEGKTKEFSLFLFSGYNCVKRFIREYDKLLESISAYNNPGLSWIVIRQNRTESLKRPADVTKALITALNEMPEVLADVNMIHVRRTISYLVKHGNIDYVYCELEPFLNSNNNNRDQFDVLFLKELLQFKGDQVKTIEILQSSFLKKIYEGTRSSQTPSRASGKMSDELHLFLSKLLDLDLQTLFKIGNFLLEHFHRLGANLIEILALRKLHNITRFNENDFNYFGKLDINLLNSYPRSREKIELLLLLKTDELLVNCLFQKIPSTLLLLNGLSRRDSITYLEKPDILSLQKILANQPRGFFTGLNFALRTNGLEETLKRHRAGKLRALCDQLQDHFDHIETILSDVTEHTILLCAIPHLLDPRVTDFLKVSGAQDRDIMQIRISYEQIRKRFIRYSHLFNKLGRLELTEAAILNEEDEEGGDFEDEDIKSENESDSEKEELNVKIIEVFDGCEWEAFLKAIEPETSTQTLKAALARNPPICTKQSKWLEQITKSKLFMETVWLPQVKAMTDTNLSGEDLSEFVEDLSKNWLALANSVNNKTISFDRMENVIALEPDTSFLTACHLSSVKPLGNVETAYKNFRNLLNIRHHITPFVAALRFFNISDYSAIENLHEFVTAKLMNNWNAMTLEEVIRMGVIDTIEEELAIDSERPETLLPIQFIASLVDPHDGNSPLIEWLGTKSEQDFEAMGKILHGALFEAYGQLQTLKTRIAPFLKQKFDKYQDLLRAIRDSENKFVQRHSGRVQEVKTEWLSQVLPEIEAAIRASTISPSEDAKEKLQRLYSINIAYDAENYAIRIRLTTGEDLSMEELKQAFQLLDMAASDGGEQLVSTIRQQVEMIGRVSDVFDALYSSRYVTHNSKEGRIAISVVELEEKWNEFYHQLAEWNIHWQKIDHLPYLSICSRDFLLYLANAFSKGEASKALGFLRMLLPSAPQRMESAIAVLAREPNLGSKSSKAAQLFELLTKLDSVVSEAFRAKSQEVALPSFLNSYGQMLETHFLGRPIVILNVTRQLIVGSCLAAYVSLTRRPVEPTRIFFVTANTRTEEVERFMRLWSVGEKADLFVIIHIERLATASATAIRDAINRVLPEHRARLLLLAQQHHRVQTTKSLGARLGLQSDRLLEIKFSADQLRECFTKLSPITANIHFLTSPLPGCGKSQLAMKLAASKRLPYNRIAVREGTVEELMKKLKSLMAKSDGTLSKEGVLHLDVAHSVSLEFNDILISLILHGALYDPRKSHLGFWRLSTKITIAVEFSSPFGVEEFPIISYLGTHHQCACNQSSFSYKFAELPAQTSKMVMLENSNELIVAAKFLELKQNGQNGLAAWHVMCNTPETMLADPVPKQAAFQLLVETFESDENRSHPTFTAIKLLATFLHRHLIAMVQSLWFNESARLVFGDCERLASIFKLDIFRLLVKVANDSLNRCWSLFGHARKKMDFDWTIRQRAMLLLGMDEYGNVTGVNVVGRRLDDLQAMFHADVRPYLRYQSLHFQELNGFRSLTESREGSETILNAIRSLLQLDGSSVNLAKARALDDHPRNTPPLERIRALLGKDLGYVLTGDNITKMMFALYRIRCGLPVIVFGEAGVGKSALFRFLIETLLGHHFIVCNVNSGTTIEDICKTVDEAGNALVGGEAKAFVLLDEMNTADTSVIAFVKELMLDRNREGEPLPENLHLIAAANPYRSLKESDVEASVGLSFRYAESKNRSAVNRELVYRVNELPRAFYDHIYDFGYLTSDAEDVYIEEICHHALKNDYASHMVQQFVRLLRKSHREARVLSSDPESAVSLRDTTRAVQLFQWFSETTIGKQLADSRETAMQLAIYLVFAFRFAEKRKNFLESVFGKNQRANNHVKHASKKIAQMLYEYAHGASIGSGAVALNDALCENLFGLFVCVLNGIFVIIVGRPGTSKSLSVEILKLVLSPGNHKLREKLGDLPALTELYFQCSPLSTSAGFKALFESAQRLSVDPKTMLAMVVLDELGLADLSPEKPIKVLHSELERKAVLTSGETRQSPYSVVALSNWVVDAAQVNRGILISRRQASKDDLLKSVKELAESLIGKFNEKGNVGRINDSLSSHLECIVEMYNELDRHQDIGGGHFYSMRDFFFCVKSFVCSVLENSSSGSVTIAVDVLIQPVVRNFGGHEKAKQALKCCLASNMKISENAITLSPVLDLVLQNIRDSSKKLSIHIARHLMILNRSLIGLQLLNRHVKSSLGEKTGWTVLFGSCFPGDLQVTAVTRKLRQVEQAIRRGGVLVLCHADQLFESLYMVLNQQYWAQGDVTMTQIALGPSIRAIALPDGPFRIIALQDTDVALNKQQMSPAVLSRFEKHELRPCSLLNERGRKLLSDIETHPVWSTMGDMRRRQLLFGYHADTLSSLALHLQSLDEDMDLDKDMEVDSDEEGAECLMRRARADVTLMRAVNPMAMVKLERDSRTNGFNLLQVFQLYRRNFISEGLEETLRAVPSNRLVVMTNTLRHIDVFPKDTEHLHEIIQLFDIQSELELDSLLNSLKPSQLNNPDFCLVIQYDAVSGPIEQFQLAKHEVDVRFSKAACNVIFVAHLDPRSVNNRWVFSFEDGWVYVFVDELSPQQGHMRLPLKALVEVGGDRPMSDFLDEMPMDRYKNLLQEMLGPILQTCLENLGPAMGTFFGGVRTAIQLAGSEEMVALLKECLVAQLDECKVCWNVLDAVGDTHFDSSSSLTEGLWEVFKQKISKPLAHLLLMSDVWRISSSEDIRLWCDFVQENFPDRLMVLNSTSTLLQIPVGLRCCTQPFGRLLALIDRGHTVSESKLSTLVNWLLKYIAKSSGARREHLRQEYFCDWMSLHVPPHLHPLVRQLPFAKMANIVDSLFDETEQFFVDWTEHESQVIAALEHVNLASFANVEAKHFKAVKRLRNWKQFVNSAIRQSFVYLNSFEIFQKRTNFVQSVTSIEMSRGMQEVIERSPELSDLWLKLRITKRMFLFDPDCEDQLYDLQDASPNNVIQCLTDLVLNSVIRPRVEAEEERRIRRADLLELLNNTAACDTANDLARIVRQCPNTNSLLVMVEEEEDKRCARCGEKLLEVNGTTNVRHLREPRPAVIDALFNDYSKFLLLFEQVAEIFIEHKRNNPQDVREFLGKLLAPDCKLRISWRFFTVIARSVLRTKIGFNIVDCFLKTMPCNRPCAALSFNSMNFLRALLVCADEDVRRTNGLETGLTWSEALLVGDWSVDRIRRLAEIRGGLSDFDAFLDAINVWAEHMRNEDNKVVLEAFVFFLVRFGTQEGDRTRLSMLLNHGQLPEEFKQHEIISEFRESFAPMALGFDLQPTVGRVIQLQQLLKRDQPIGHLFRSYDILEELSRQWAPYIARFAVHAADIARSKGIGYLNELASNPVGAGNMFLPGIDNHPYLASYHTREGRWYVCDCQTLCWVLNCGQPTTQSICGGCRRALATTEHVARTGIRLATAADFSPPRGIHIARNPAASPTYSVRNRKPTVTRLSLLLNSLCLLNGLISREVDDETAQKLMRTLPLTERINRNGQVDGHRSLGQLLVQHIMVNLDALCKLIVTKPLTTPDQFRIGHLILHRLLESTDQSLVAYSTGDFEASVAAREDVENAFDRLITNQTHLEAQLDRIDDQADEASQNFQKAMKRNETRYWTYSRLVFSNREMVQLALARDGKKRNEFKFLDLLLDDEQWAPKLDALVHLGDAIRFIALVRSTLQGTLSREEVEGKTISHGIERIVELLEEGAVILDRGRLISKGDQVRELFHGFQQLWNRFSNIPNAEHKTFLEFFECQQVDVRVRPDTTLRDTAPLTLILAGSNTPEMAFTCQLLANAVEAANSIAQIDFVKRYCRKGSTRTRLNCSTAAGLAEFDESLYAHVSREQVDRFIVDHVIDDSTLYLAESFAMISVLGSAGSAIAADIFLDPIPEFSFKEANNSESYIISLERRFSTWQPTALSNPVEGLILADLEKNRSLGEARALITSALTHLICNTEPLIISQVRKSYVTDILKELISVGILTEQHVSTQTLDAFNRHGRLQVHQAMNLLKSILKRMKGEDLFGGRILPGWDVMMSERLVHETTETMRAHAENDIRNNLLEIANVIGTTQPAPKELSPDKSLLNAVRLYEGDEWQGIPAELTLAYLGHALLIAEAL